MDIRAQEITDFINFFKSSKENILKRHSILVFFSCLSFDLSERKKEEHGINQLLFFNYNHSTFRTTVLNTNSI